VAGATRKYPSATTQCCCFNFCTNLLRASIFARGMAIPLLVNPRLASNGHQSSIIQAVSRIDYLLGKSPWRLA